MDRDGWLRAMTQLSTVCSAYTINNKILFFDGYVSHFNDCAHRYMKHQNIQTFVLKPYNSINHQPNDNGVNAKLKYRCNYARRTNTSNPFS